MSYASKRSKLIFSVLLALCFVACAGPTSPGDDETRATPPGVAPVTTPDGVMEAATVLSTIPAWPTGSEDFNVWQVLGRQRAPSPALAQLIEGGHRVSIHEGLGLPSFFWVAASSEAKTPSGADAAPGEEEARARPTPSRPDDDAARQPPAQQGGPANARLDPVAVEEAARLHLRAHADLYRLDDATIDRATLEHVHDTGRGPVIARLGQRVDGVEVLGARLSVLMDRTLEPVAFSGSLIPQAHGDARGNLTTSDPLTPLSTALADATRLPISGDALRAVDVDSAGFQRFALAQPLPGGWTMRAPLRVKAVYFPLPEGPVLAHHVEVALSSPTGDVARAYVIAARDGRLLLRRGLIQNERWSYRVWADPATLQPLDSPQGNAFTPHPTGRPDGTDAPFVETALVQVDDGLNESRDPWLPPNAIQTSGNNVDAYADISGRNGFDSNDLRADLTDALTFDRDFDVERGPQADDDQIKAAVTQLFYVNNYLHDVFYDFGFDEDAGNAQVDNYNRGGAEGDPLLTEAQDFSGFNNANMFTPADGASPQMQMFLYDYAGRIGLSIDPPSALAGDVNAGGASFNPDFFDISGALALVDDQDDGGGAGSLVDGCQPIVNDVTGQLAVIERGTCTFVEKVKNAQNAGAIGAIIMNDRANEPDFIMEMGGADQTITIPSLFMSYRDGETLRGELAGGAVSARLLAGPLRDGTIDNQVVIHEWAHYLYGRLTSGVDSNSQSGGMNEGGSDYVALIMSVREDDAQAPGNDRYQGVYGLATYSSASPYFGTRRVPYSTDFAVNPLTFRHISDAEPLPDDVPLLNFGAPNSEVHNTGEVWATIMWECYAALLNERGYAEGRARMMGDLVAALQLFPADPTFTEARDAFLSVAFARDPEDFTLYWEAFARRGLGVSAVAPERFSTDHTDLVESFDLGGDIAIGEILLKTDPGQCDDDAYLDPGERGQVEVTLSNVGVVALEQTTLRVSALSPGVRRPRPGVIFPEGDTVDVPDIDPLQSVTVSIPVLLEDALPFDAILIEARAEDVSAPFPRQSSTQALANLDETPASSASDDVESAQSAWTPSASDDFPPTEAWEVADGTETGRRWHGPALGGQGDLRLTSPPLEATPGEDLVLRFEHRFEFEFDGRFNAAFDGGVIEISSDEGQTWEDIGVLADPGYNSTIVNLARDFGAGLSDNNPLADRPAFSGRSPDYPALTPVTVDLGSNYAGETVQVRFRVGSDPAVGANGWEIDNIAFEGVSNTPFSSLQEDSGACAARPVANAGIDQSVSSGGAVSLDGSASTAPNPDTALTFIWTQVAGPGVVLDDPNSATPSFTAPKPAKAATLTFQLVVSDGSGLSEPGTVSISVSARKDDDCGCATVRAGSSSPDPAPATTLAFALLAAALVVARRQRSSQGR